MENIKSLRDIYALQEDSLLLQKVESYANSTTNSKQRANARSLLTQVFGTTFPYITEPMNSVQYRKKGQDVLTADHQDIMIYPNPNNGQMTLEYQLSENTVNANIRMYDVNGRVVFEKNLLVTDEKQVEQISLTGLSGGLYFYQIGNSEKTLDKGKIIIQK